MSPNQMLPQDICREATSAKTAVCAQDSTANLILPQLWKLSANEILFECLICLVSSHRIEDHTHIVRGQGPRQQQFFG